MRTIKFPFWAFLVFVGACGDTVSIDGGTSTGEYGYEDGSESGDIDEEVCEPDGCASDAECCPSPLIECGPNVDWPNRWDCVAGECVNLGCLDTSECYPGFGFECYQLEENGPGFCIIPCNPLVEGDCDAGGTVGNATGKTSCWGETVDEEVFYCKEGQPP